MDNHKDPEWLRHQYLTLGKSTSEIGAELGIKPKAVQYQLTRAGVQMRGRGCGPGSWKPKTCARCATEFKPSGPSGKFCSAACRLGTKPCEACGVEFVLTAQTYERKFCSKPCAYRSRPVRDPRGKGRYVDKAGYVMIRVPDGTPGAMKKPTHSLPWMFEHRYVMQESLGRPLRRGETVHHIDGDKQNNALENLQLRTGNHGKGAAFECLDCGSHNVGAVELKDAA